MRVPSATYRIQFGPDFHFEDAELLLSYLRDLGISDIYASPIFEAVEGSSHGYDVVNPGRLNPEIGSLEQFQHLTSMCREYGLGWLQDIVPNHMAYNCRNKMLMDVFEYGRKSRYFRFFDVFWDHPDPELTGKIMAPFLGKPLMEVLQSTELKLRITEAGFTFGYYEKQLPLAVYSYSRIIERNVEHLRTRLSAHERKAWDEVVKHFASVAQNRGDLSAIEDAKHALWSMYRDCGPAREHIDDNIRYFSSFEAFGERPQPVEKLLDQQLYRLTYWKTAAEKINYRRFFHLTDYISIRVEDETVFDEMHALCFSMLDGGFFDGIRIDHIDGLYDCRQYLERLRKRAGDTYIVLEKILELSESLPSDWPVQGTTGYDFCNYVNELFCSPATEPEFTDIYADFTRATVDFHDSLYAKKRFICEKHFRGDFFNAALAYRAIRREGNDQERHDLEILETALIEITANLGVYRTYISEDTFSNADRKYIEEALDGARRRRPDIAEIIDSIGHTLCLDMDADAANKQAVFAFIKKFQQLTGPSMAKGFEDTLLYTFGRLVSLNEVGSDPSLFGIEPGRFHDFNVARAKNHPHTMNALSTHDTKRSEDVRARINVLSEIPDEWRARVEQWSRLNSGFKTECNNRAAPDARDEYMLYQTLIGVWPFGFHQRSGLSDRVKQYTIKAVREAKVNSNWITPNDCYEQACLDFVDDILREGSDFLADFLSFQKKVAGFGVFNSLSQTMLKMTSPGVPDCYQGTEIWDFSLVDPDNRRAVDFDRRKRMLEEIKSACNRDRFRLIDKIIASPEDGRVKMLLVWSVLNARREQPTLFESGDYVPALVEGVYADHVVAFVRAVESQYAVVVAPRFLTALVGPGEQPLGDEVWKDTRTRLPRGRNGECKDIITGENVRLSDEPSVGSILRRFPVALLLSV